MVVTIENERHVTLRQDFPDPGGIRGRALRADVKQRLMIIGQRAGRVIAVEILLQPFCLGHVVRVRSGCADEFGYVIKRDEVPSAGIVTVVVGYVIPVPLVASYFRANVLMISDSWIAN